ncbi:hypothetical protein EDB80DRAFT_147668 [Ilyonectria destructans]|nr:hypothetical protein EDB80DRAFT_147668 [Ilyonectria destructans]
MTLFCFSLSAPCARAIVCLTVSRKSRIRGSKTGPNEGSRCNHDDKACDAPQPNQNPRAGTKVTSRFFAPNWWIDGVGRACFKALSLIGAVVSSLPSIRHGQ